MKCLAAVFTTGVIGLALCGPPGVRGADGPPPTATAVPVVAPGSLPVYVIDNHWRDIRGCSQYEPVHWRTATGCLRLLDEQGLEPDVHGLDALRLSGSAEPTLVNLKWMAGVYGKDFTVVDVDLRQETHVYVDGLPISRFQGEDQVNWGKPDEAVREEEREWTAALEKQGKVTLYKLGAPKGGVKAGLDPEEMSIRRAQTEEDVAREAGVRYFRICVPDYHPPAPWQVDQFLEFVEKLPSATWLHFHCAAGDGRTTTFMVMWDILQNGRQVSLEDITTRQARLGGIDLLSPPPGLAAEPSKKQSTEARAWFLRGFYDYVRSGAYPSQKYSEWLTRQPPTAYGAILKTKAYGPAPAGVRATMKGHESP